MWGSSCCQCHKTSRWAVICSFQYNLQHRDQLQELQCTLYAQKQLLHASEKMLDSNATILYLQQFYLYRNQARLAAVHYSAKLYPLDCQFGQSRWPASTACLSKNMHPVHLESIGWICYWRTHLTESHSITLGKKTLQVYLFKHATVFQQILLHVPIENPGRYKWSLLTLCSSGD